jgi:hypothetical protein
MKVYKDDAFTKACGAQVSYGFYGRAGGVSGGIYTSLNCGTGSGDDQQKVRQNRAFIAQHLGVGDAPISTLWQCHSAQCLHIFSHVAEDNARPKADALVTDVAGLAIGVLTADCGPVLFTAQKPDGAPVIGAAHAGWGGALGGVLEDTVHNMVQAGAMSDSIIACVGPCIQQVSYEVGNDFMAPFLARHDEAERFFKSGAKEGHSQFDLSGYIAFRLALCGVQNVRLTGVDTYREEETCFSYRRATHRGEPDYGRQMSCIVIKP